MNDIVTIQVTSEEEDNKRIYCHMVYYTNQTPQLYTSCNLMTLDDIKERENIRKEFRARQDARRKS